MSDTELTCSKLQLIVALFKYVTNVYISFHTERINSELNKTGIIHNNHVTELYMYTIYRVKYKLLDRKYTAT
jgi:hypothetical protein